MTDAHAKKGKDRPLFTPDNDQKSFGTDIEIPFEPIAVFIVVTMVVNCAAVIPGAHSRSTPSKLSLRRGFRRLLQQETLRYSRCQQTGKGVGHFRAGATSVYGDLL